MVDRMSGQRDLAWLRETLRTSTKPLTRKRIKKLAAQLSEAAICESLRLPEKLFDRHLYIMEHPDGAHVERWGETGQTFVWMDDTPEVLRLAQTELLRRRGYPVFRSLEEAQAFAARQFWPGAKADKPKT
jgi:hypothetical protein